MNRSEYILMVARGNASRELLSTPRGQAGPLTVADIRKAHEVVTRGLGDIDPNFSPSKGVLRLGAMDAVRLASMVNNLQNDRLLGPSTRGRVSENCAKIIGEFSKAGVFNSFNTEVGIVVAQRYARSCGLAVRFHNIEPEAMEQAVKSARQGQPNDLTRLIGGEITHESVYRADVAHEKRPEAGGRMQIKIPENLAEKLRDFNLELEPMEPKPSGPRM